MKALVTGSTGFLGRHLCRELIRREWKVDKLHRSGWDLKSCGDEYGYDYIFHLAAYTQAGDWCLKNSGEQWLVNQKINTKILEIWREWLPNAKLITIGSSCAYAPGSNLKEEDYMRGEPHESLYTYAMTKRMLYEGCRALNKQYGMKYLYLVPSTLYGPDYHRDGRQAHFIFDLIRKIIRGKELGEPVVLWGDGYQTREVLYVKDFVEAIILLDEKIENDIINVGGNHCYSIREFAAIICQVVGYDAKQIIYDESKYVGAKSKSLNIEKICKIIPELQITNVGVALFNTVDWFYKSGAWK